MGSCQTSSRSLWRIAGCFHVCWLLSAVAAYSDDSSAGVDAYIRTEMEARHIPGVAVAVMKNGQVWLAKGYGLANVELRVPVTEDTVYQLASVTKQFTATAIMQLIQDEKLRLDDELGKLLEDTPAAWRVVTVRQLLNHTSGIPSYTDVPEFSKAPRRDLTKDEVLRFVAELPVEFAPGQKWKYSNTGYFLLGMILEKVSGQTYGDFLDARIFKPLGMSATRLNDLRAIIQNRATGYKWAEGRLLHGEYVSPTQPYAAGALVSTVADLARWDAALYTEKLLKREQLEAMWTPGQLNDGQPLEYGYGWAADDYRTRKRISHGGGIDGFSTYIARFVDDQLTVVVLTNQEAADAGSLSMGIAGFYLPALLANAPRPIDDSDSKLTEFHKDVVIGLAQGQADPAWFTPQMREFLFPDRIKEGQETLGSHGPLKSFELLSEKHSNATRRRDYKAVFGDFQLRCTFELTEDGKIAGLGLRPL